MTASFFHYILDIIINAFFILCFQLLMIILSIRFGWFVWTYKMFKKLRKRLQAKKQAKASQEENKEVQSEN